MLNDYLEEQLEKTGVSLEEFRELCLRLLNYGVLCRDESQVEQQFYDRYVRTQELINAYLQVLGIRILHDQRFAYVRLYPPGASIPGVEDDAQEGAFSGGLRARLRQDEVALLLALRLLYDKALREGQVDENGVATESMEGIGLAMRNHLGRTLPEKLTDRKRAFERLRKLRLIRYGQDHNFESNEAGLKIHPMIVNFVSADVLDAAAEPLAAESDASTTEEADHVS